MAKDRRMEACSLTLSLKKGEGEGSIMVVEWRGREAEVSRTGLFEDQRGALEGGRE